MSFDFAPPPRRTNGESIVPMINVVFLLLIFFLMTSRLGPPAPFEVTPPRAPGDGPGQAAPVLYLSPEGEAGFGTARGAGAIAAWRAADRAPGVLPRLRADKSVEARVVARLLKALAADGVESVALEVAR